MPLPHISITKIADVAQNATASLWNATYIEIDANFAYLDGIISALGNGASLNVGTTAGTLAAGNDSRFLTPSQKTAFTGGGDTNLHFHAADRQLSNAIGILAVNKGGTGVGSIAEMRTMLGITDAAGLPFGTTAATICEGNDARILAAVAHDANTSNPHNVTKAQVGLGNVDNTADLDKPVSTATQTALDLKLDASAYNQYYLGRYTTLASLQTAYPTSTYGHYAIVDPGAGADAIEYIYDEQAGWIVSGTSASPITSTDGLIEGATNFYFTAARVMASVLTGFTAGAGTVSAADSILQALQKIVANLAAWRVPAGGASGQILAKTSAADNAVSWVNQFAPGDVYSYSAQTASYTLVAGDQDTVAAPKIVTLSNASANTLTVPPNSSVAFPVGARVNFIQIGAGQTTITAGAGVTLQGTPGLKCRAQFSPVTLIKSATDTWYVIGDLSA